MKRLFFLLLFPGILASLFAYNYQTVYSHRTAMYQNREGKIIGFKTDSVVFNGDSVLYPLKNIQPTNQNCYTLNGASWMGGKIIVKPDWNYFFNENNDTLKIKTNARFHEGWRFFENEDVIVEAIIYFHDTMTVLGVVDSVKTIELQAYYKTTSGNFFAHETLLLSKRFGLVKTMNFLVFPELFDYNYFPRRLESFSLVGLDQPKLGIQNLTWFDVHDFQPGDEMHALHVDGQYYGFQLPMIHTENSTRDMLRYLKRTDFADSIVYEIDRNRSVIAQTNDSIRWVTYRRDTIQTTIRRNEKFDQLPGTPVLNEGMVMLYRMEAGDPVSKSDMDYNLFFTQNAPDCWSIPPWDGCMFVNKYLKGLGGPYGYCSGMGGETIQKDIVYYQKGNKTWGTPFKKINTNYKPLIQKKRVWNVLRSSCCPDIQSYRHTEILKFGGDSVSGPHIFTKLLSAYDPTSSVAQLQGYLREDILPNRVYFKPLKKAEVLLYDFSLMTGDSVFTSDFRFNGEMLVCNRVDSVDSVRVANVLRKRMYISSFHTQMPGQVTNHVWIEGVGGTRGLLSSSLPAMIGGEIYSLLCLSENGGEIYHHPELDNCFYWQDFKESLPYQSVYPNRTALYKNGLNHLISMKIDSVGYLNPQEFYPMKSIRRQGDICFDPAGASFLGERILIENGWNYYFDRQGDAISVKTHARVGDSWVLSQKLEMKIQASVTSVENMNILGLNDSVLVIKLMAYDKNMNVLLTHPLNNRNIRLSRLNGWVTIFNLYDLPFTDGSQLDMYELAGIDKPKAGVQNLTWFEVFDFQPGDEFHTEYSYLMYTAGPSTSRYARTIRNINSRTDYRDSIVYEVSDKIEETRLYGANVTFRDVSDKSFRWRIQKNDIFDMIPGKPFIHDNSLKTSYMKVTEFVQKGISSIPYNADTACFTFWEDVISDVCDFGSSEYYQGLGGPYYSYTSGCWPIEGTTEVNRLLYYKKGNLSRGTPYIINSTDNPSGNGISVFPNPTRGLLELKIDEFMPGLKVSVLDIHGSVILQQDVLSSGQMLDVTALATGIYFCRFTRGNEVLKVARFSKF